MAVSVVILFGCGDDLPDGVVETTAQGSSSSGSNEDIDGTADETGESGNPVADGTPCDVEDEIGEEYAFQAPSAEEVTLNGELDCNFDYILNGEDTLEDADEFDIWVYRPQESEEDGDWPDGQFPAVFMSPGNGQRVHGTGVQPHRYLPMLEQIARAGFVAIAIDPDDDGWSSGKRRAALACAMIWARDESSGLSDHLANAMAILGHSRGAGAAWLLSEDKLEATNLPTDTTLDDWEQCAVITIAQPYNSTPGGDPTNTDRAFADQAAPPLLALLGAIDEDTTTDQVRAYDNRYSEALIGTDASALDRNDELLLLVYGFGHGEWGGTNSGGDSLISPYYVPEFLRWQFLGEQQRRVNLVAPMAWNADSESFPMDIASSSRWTSGLNEIYYSGCEATPPSLCPEGQGPLEGLGRPLIYANYTQGVNWNGANRFALDLMEEGRESGPYCEDFGSSGSDLPPSTAGGAVVAELAPNGEDPIICEASAASLLDGISDDSYDAHDTGALFVQWGGTLGGASVRWLLPGEMGVTPSGISTATHLSFRIGNVLTDNDDTSCETPLDEFSLRVELRDIYHVIGEVAGPVITITPHIDPQAVEVDFCRAAQFMHTVRIPLPNFCDSEESEPLAIDNLAELVFHFDDDEETHTAVIDSLEFTHDPFLPGDPAGTGECPHAAPSSWNCIADELVATQTSCSGEPISGECDIIDIEETPVSLPEVEIPNDTFEGWVVHIPKGWLQDPEDPTEDELDDILDRCIAACELEYADDPFVSADCSATDAFLEPTLRETPNVGAILSVPADLAHGDDLFPGESLDCDLRSDCSAAFDENIGPSRLRRPSPASEPLHRGEEWLLSVTGEMEAGSSYQAEPPMMLFSLEGGVTAAMGGTVGYSRCAAGNAETCPFYLASADLELLEPLQLDLECDSELVSHELTELSIRLVQPAFGIAEEGTSFNAFPPGGLVFEAEGIVDEIPFHSRIPIQNPVYLYASDGLLTIQGGLDGFLLDFQIPCNGIMADLEVAWNLVEDEVLAGPPTLGIGHLPATMECPDELPLTLQWTDDPEADYESLQWIVDGVLLDGEFPTLPMTESHQITAVLRDSRGAGGSATTVVACE